MLHFVHSILFLRISQFSHFSPALPTKIFYTFLSPIFFFFDYCLHLLLSQDGGNRFLRNLYVSVPGYNVTSRKITEFIFITRGLQIVEIYADQCHVPDGIWPAVKNLSFSLIFLVWGQVSLVFMRHARKDDKMNWGKLPQTLSKTIFKPFAISLVHTGQKAWCSQEPVWVYWWKENFWPYWKKTADYPVHTQSLCYHQKLKRRGCLLRISIISFLIFVWSLVTPGNKK